MGGLVGPSGGAVNLTGPITSIGAATSVAAQTGTGSVFVMQQSPSLITPNLGTPSAIVLSNATGTAAGLTAGSVTTNANLTGMVTSVGNATTVVTNANLTGVITSVGNATSFGSTPWTGNGVNGTASGLYGTPNISVGTISASGAITGLNFNTAGWQVSGPASSTFAIYGLQLANNVFTVNSATGAATFNYALAAGGGITSTAAANSFGATSFTDINANRTYQATFTNGTQSLYVGAFGSSGGYITSNAKYNSGWTIDDSTKGTISISTNPSAGTATALNISIGAVNTAPSPVATFTSTGLALASGTDLTLGRAYSAGVVVPTGSIIIKDSTGTSYRIPAVI